MIKPVYKDDKGAEYTFCDCGLVTYDIKNKVCHRHKDKAYKARNTQKTDSQQQEISW